MSRSLTVSKETGCLTTLTKDLIYYYPNTVWTKWLEIHQEITSHGFINLAGFLITFLNLKTWIETSSYMP